VQEDRPYRRQVKQAAGYISKCSPTITTGSILLSCIIDAQEERDVAVIEIPNAFIQTRIDDKVMWLLVRSVESSLTYWLRLLPMPSNLTPLHIGREYDN
jgi:hypothetical protein